MYPMHPIGVTVNGRLIEAEVPAHRTLLDFLRGDAGLPGTKQGCDSGDCGACSVLLNGELVVSCLLLAVEADRGDVLTVEGLAPGAELHPLQEAFVAAGAVQCGFCTPGMLMAAKALLDVNREPTEVDVRAALGGNLCRCTGYERIVRAVLAAAREGASAVATR